MVASRPSQWVWSHGRPPHSRLPFPKCRVPNARAPTPTLLITPNTFETTFRERSVARPPGAGGCRARGARRCSERVPPMPVRAGVPPAGRLGAAPELPGRPRHPADRLPEGRSAADRVSSAAGRLRPLAADAGPLRSRCRGCPWAGPRTHPGSIAAAARGARCTAEREGMRCGVTSLDFSHFAPSAPDPG